MCLVVFAKFGLAIWSSYFMIKYDQFSSENLEIEENLHISSKLFSKVLKNSLEK